jgi:hypothetical protein
MDYRHDIHKLLNVLTNAKKYGLIEKNSIISKKKENKTKQQFSTAIILP